jgi:hypothetical protein
VNFTGNLQALDNAGQTRTDVSLNPDVTGLTSLTIGQSSTSAASFTSTNNSNFTTGAGTGFYYGGATGSLVGQNTISSTGAFTGTLFALTADSTQTGTILGISGQSLTSGKAIDVSLGAAYNLVGADSSGKNAGAVNVRAGAYNGNIFNVLSTANTGADTMNLANLESGQTMGQLLKIRTTGTYTGSATTGILNIDANTATGGTVARISATGLTGATNQALSITLGASSSATAILADTGATYTGSLIDLRMAGASQFKVNNTATTVAGNLVGSNATSFQIDATGALPINLGTTANTGQVNIARSGQLTNVGGTLTAASTLTVTGTTPSSALVVSGSTGNLAAQGLGSFGPAAGNQLIVQGAPTLSGVQIRSVGSVDTNVAISIAPAGTGRVKVIGSSGGLDVDNDIVAGAALANKLQLLGGATTVPVNVKATGIDTNITLQLTPKGTGTVQVNGTGGLVGPASAAFLVDSTGLQNINIGGTSGATLNLGRTGQIQALLGNVTVGGTLAVTGDVSVNVNKFNVTAATGAVAFVGDLAINTNKFTVAAATGNTVIAGTLMGSGATGFAIDSSATQPLTLGTAATTTSVTISRAGQTTTVAGLLVVTGNATFNGTVKVGATGIALTEIRIGTCTNPATVIGTQSSVDVTCTIVGGVQDLRSFVISLTPTGTPPAFVSYAVGLTTATAITIHWVNVDQTTQSTGALTFMWTAVR